MSPSNRKNTSEAGSESDETLMIRAGRGDVDAFGEIVSRHQKTVLNFVHRFLGLTPDAEDLCHDVFLRIYRYRSSYKPTARFTTFLYRTTLNLCLNHLRSRRLRKTVPLEHQSDDGTPAMNMADDQSPSPEDEILSSERARLVREAVDALPESQRTAVLLLRWEELSYNEIAEVMELSIMAVKSLLSRAKENLRERLSARLIDGD